MIKNMVGLEAEFFVLKDNELVFPSDYGFSTDEFIILGEFRAEPGNNRSETIANFLKAYYDTVEKATKNGVNISLIPSYTIDLEFWSKILKRLGMKEISQSKNIYGTDILKMSDAVISEGKLVGHNLTIGLHIHFSSSEINERKVLFSPMDNYIPVYLPLSIGENLNTTINLYQKTGTLPSKEEIISSYASRITKPVLEYMIKRLDNELLPIYSDGVKEFKFRQPGYYELKSHGGFEYRSLPMRAEILDSIFNIVDFSFDLLESLDL